MKTNHVVAALGFALALLLASTIVPHARAADPSPIIGNWEGTLDPGAQAKKRIVVHITAGQDGSLAGTIDYPDENASGALITAITYKEPTLHLECSSSLAVFDGATNKEGTEITGELEAGRYSGERDAEENAVGEAELLRRVFMRVFAWSLPDRVPFWFAVLQNRIRA